MLEGSPESFVASYRTLNRFTLNYSSYSFALRFLRTHILRLLGPKTILYIRPFGYFDP